MARQKSKLACLREQRGLTQKEVADELGITRQAVSQWEAGTTTPSMEKLLDLSRLYGVTLGELTSTKDETTEKEVAKKLPETTAKKRSIAPGVVLAAYTCFVIGVLLWGHLRNSLFFATNYIICGTLLFALGWGMKLLYSIYKYIWRNKNNEKK